MPGPSSSCVPWSSTPPGAYRPSPISRCGRCCLQARQYLGHPETYFFRGYLPTAHSLACLRIAESVTVSGARLATGRAGSPFAGRVSHPLDDKRGFMKSSHTPFPLDQPCLVALSEQSTPAYDLIGYFSRLDSATELNDGVARHLGKLLRRHDDPFIKRVLSLRTQHYMNTHTSKGPIEQVICSLLEIGNVSRIGRRN